jgi:hypothetical protein
MVAVFKTDVSTKIKAKAIIKLIQSQMPGCKINFDLEDCDNVLRIEGEKIKEQKIIGLLHRYKIQCEELI